MCIVYAPDFQGEYDLYDELHKLVQKYNPKFMLVQGGEVLAQKESMDWLEKLQDENKDLDISLVTNGSVGSVMTQRAEKLYRTILVSFVGFQDETYKKVMGLSVEKTKMFVDTLNQSNDVEMLAKYLCTPINLHEANLFIEWAIGIDLKTIILSDSNVKQYLIEGTWDDYWDKIFDSTAKDIKKVILKNKRIMIDKNIKIYVQSSL